MSSDELDLHLAHARAADREMRDRSLRREQEIDEMLTRILAAQDTSTQR